MCSDIKAETINSLTWVSIVIWVHPSPSDVEDVLFYFRVKITLKYMSFSFPQNIYFFKLGERFHSEPAFELKFVFTSFWVVEYADIIPITKPAILLVLHDVFPGPEGIAGMVPRDVDDHAHFATVDFVDEF